MSDDESTVLVRNVTDERTRQAALEDERQRLAAVLDSTSAIIYAASLPDFRIDYISESVFPVLGFTREEFASPGFWESAVHPDDWPRVSTELPRLFEKGEHVTIKEGPFQGYEGTVDELFPEKGVVRVLVTIFGRQAPIDLEEWQIGKAEGT